MKKRIVIIGLALFACNSPKGSEPDDPTKPPMMLGPDEDSDEWPDDNDNCPKIANPEQRDRDRDGIGNVCDSCPATPNNDPTGIGQSHCTLISEAEPNDTIAQAITLPKPGQIIAIQGVIEAPVAQQQATDRFSIMVDANTLLSIRCARASPLSLLEPHIEVSGAGYTISRRTHAQHIASRQFYFSTAGQYEIVVSDRRMQFDFIAKGSPEYAYELAIQTAELEVDPISPPLLDRPFRIDETGNIAAFSAALKTSAQVRLEVKTMLGPGSDGSDPILIVEHSDGSLWEENHKYTPGIYDARVLLELDADETVRIIVDHREVLGRSDEPLLFSVDYPDLESELEPNHTPELASKLNYCQGCETSGTINSGSAEQDDVDWFVFDALAGQIVSFRGLIPSSSQVDPYMELGQFESSLFVPIYENGTSSGVSARFDAVIPTDGTYYLRYQDELNKENENGPYRGGSLYPYKIFTEFLIIPPAPELVNSSAQTGVINPGGTLNRYTLTVDHPVNIQLVATKLQRFAPLTPMIRVYNPGAKGLVIEGENSVDVNLTESGTYVIAIHNAEQGQGGPEYTYELVTTISSL